MTAILLALVCAFAYGIADFWGALATRRASILKVLPVIVISGIVMLLCFWPFLGADFSHDAIRAGLFAGLSGVFGYALVMYSLALGPMSVVAPLTAVTAAIIPFTVGIVRGDQLSPVSLLGAAIALISIVLVSRTTEDATHPITRKAVVSALLAGVAVSGYLLGISSGPTNSGIAPVLVARCFTGALFVIAALTQIKRLGQEEPNYKLAIASGSLDVWGGTGFMLATRHGALALVSVIGALYPALTVLLARIVLHERLERHQVIGLGGAGLAVVLLTLG